jgi:DNA polymerase elongation subunit (family B)
MKEIFLDTECYPNYFLICFKSDKITRFYEFTSELKLNINEVRGIMENFITIGFNSKNYDLPMIVYALKGVDNLALKKLSDDIITGKKPWELLRKYNLTIPSSWDHIDIIEPAPSVNTGLKMYGARMHTKTLQDLPIEPDAYIEKQQYELLKQYCENDVSITIELYERIRDRISLRKTMGDIYNLDLRSKSDAQIAEAVITSVLKCENSLNKVDTNKLYKYSPPSYIKFSTKELQNLIEDLHDFVEFKCKEDGKLDKDCEIDDQIHIFGKLFSIGIGGLHSNEKHESTTIEDDEFLLDVDVVSYYPSIIINNRYYPENLGEKFIELYKKIYDERILAKLNNNKLKAETYKIILNGAFGKFGSKWSALYSPYLLLHTTLTGQLSLLMLIEVLMSKGFDVVSANTDGITIKGKKNKLSDLDTLLLEWQEKTEFKLEKTNYKAIYHESVNSYIALLQNNEVKCKGYYAMEGLNKNPNVPICIEAIINFIRYGLPIEDTILNGKNDIRKYLIIRKVTGGAVYKDQYLGKVIRWYYGLNGDVITYKKNGNKVPMSDGAIPLMVLLDTPVQDIDFQKYIDISYKMLKKLGVKE